MSTICRTMYENFSKLLPDGNQKDFYLWVLANGKAFKGRVLTREERKELQMIVSRRLFTPRSCVLQSQTGCVDGKFRYFEGQANTKSLGVPLEHAWLVDKDDRVWDATWKDGDDYFGIEIPAEYIRKNILATGEAQFLLGKYYGECVNGKS